MLAVEAKELRVRNTGINHTAHDHIFIPKTGRLYEDIPGMCSGLSKRRLCKILTTRKLYNTYNTAQFKAFRQWIYHATESHIRTCLPDWLHDRWRCLYTELHHYSFRKLQKQTIKPTAHLMFASPSTLWWKTGRQDLFWILLLAFVLVASAQ